MATDPRADLDTVEKRLLDMLSNGQDGVETGLKTTEFWVALSTLATDLFSPTLHVSDTDRLVTATVIVMAYAGLRTWRKNGGPARLVAAIASLRKAALGN